MAKVFISYRRSDSTTFTGRIYDRLVAKFGRKNVFKDVDDIPAGVNFATYIQDSLGDCAAALVVIGPHWLDARNATGERRLDDPADFVRLEIEAAFALGLTVIPILLDGAIMPAQSQLPVSLRDLSLINGLVVRNDPDFSRDMERVISSLERAFAARPSLGLFGRRGRGSSPAVAQPPFASQAAPTPARPTPPKRTRPSTPRRAPLPATPSPSLRTWRPLVAGLAAVLVVASFGVLLSKGDLALLTARNDPTTRTIIHATATATEGKLTFPYSAPAPGSSCDKGPAHWNTFPFTTISCLTNPTRARLQATADNPNALVGFSLTAGGLAGQLPSSYALSMQVSNEHPGTTVYLALLASSSGNFSSGCPDDQYLYALDATGHYTLENSGCTQSLRACGSFASGNADMASPLTLALAVSSARVDGRVNDTSVGSCTDTTMSTLSAKVFVQMQVYQSGPSNQADFANFSIAP